MRPAEPWRSVAPEAFAAFDQVEARAAAVDLGVMAPVRHAVARRLLDPSEPADAPELDPPEPDDRAEVCVRFAEQFVVDVSGITDEQRSQLTTTLGSEAFTFVQALFVADVFRRARLALTRLHGVGWGPAPEPRADDLWLALEQFMLVVARGAALDPLTTELVRLRGAGAHRCRLCQSRLSVRALDHAGDRAPFAAVDDYEHSDLAERHKIALRLTDSVITQPALIDDELVDEVRRTFSLAESTEIVLDVVRNAANKIAVALAADAPQVADGVEFFDVDAAGEVVASTDPDLVRAATAGASQRYLSRSSQGRAKNPQSGGR